MSTILGDRLNTDGFCNLYDYFKKNVMCNYKNSLAVVQDGKN